MLEVGYIVIVQTIIKEVLMKFYCLVSIDCPDVDGFEEHRITERHVRINSIVQETLQCELDEGTFPGATLVNSRRFIP